MGTAPHENRTRQTMELALLASMYPTEYALYIPACPSTNNASQDVKCSVQLQPSYKLELSLPDQYPESAAPIAYLECGGDVGTANRQISRAKLTELVKWSWEVQKGECLDVLVEEFGGWLKAFCSSSSLKNNKKEGSSHGLNMVRQTMDDCTSSRHPQVLDNYKQDTDTSKNERKIKRVLLWSHHLLATSKRRDILAWSRELHLGGYSRPGYPGAIFVEGEAESVDEFISRIKGLRWQALQVRAEEAGGYRKCGDGIDGVSEVEGLGEVVERLRKNDESVATMFLEGMKIGH